MKRMFTCLVLFAASICLPFTCLAQGGGVATAITPPTGAYNGLPAPYLYTPPIACTVAAGSTAYLPTSIDVGANHVGCIPLTAGMVLNAVQLKPCTVPYATSVTLGATCSYNYVPMTGNVTSSTLVAGADGAQQTLYFCSTGTVASSFALPSTVRGTISTTLVALNKCTIVQIQYVTPLTSWVISSTAISL